MAGLKRIKRWEAVCFVTTGLLTLTAMLAFVAYSASRYVDDARYWAKYREQTAAAFENPACSTLVKMPVSELPPAADIWQDPQLSRCVAVVDHRRSAHLWGRPTDITAAEIRAWSVTPDLSLRAFGEFLFTIVVRSAMVAGFLLAALYGLGLLIELATGKRRIADAPRPNLVNLPVAGRGRRLASFVLDSAFALALPGLVMVAFELSLWAAGGFFVFGSFPTDFWQFVWYVWGEVWSSWQHPSAAGVVLGVGLYVTYYFAQEALWGTTLGKRITGAAVVAVDGSPTAVLQTLKRSLARVVPFEPLSFLGSRPDGWHDRWSGTRVVSIRST
jgi:uncharacterized RDD family membrane protein YckC